ncbi:FAD-dependent oxidoreductase [Spirochaeta cellobiosiphila]|uniref:FAD-dependent oxidoreductase n=1 Tax=Spirochaeta cellobiosiphila TaxID=504483 RepID=UPI000420518E|nr:FAD-dependent oxidoreductase [Spirochaeta cellobiosiphila]
MKKRFSILWVSLLLLSLMACGNHKEAQIHYTPGTYEGTGQGHNGDIEVEVTLSENKIENIKIVKNTETESIAQTAMTKIPDSIIKEQSLAVDTVTGATLASEAIVNAVTDALKKSGVDVTKLQIEKKKDEKTQVKSLKADMVIIGSGAAGTAAALTATEEGATVIVLEKAPVPGGLSKLAGGIFAIDSTDQKKAGVAGTYTLQDIIAKWQNYNAYLSDANMFYSVFHNSGDTADWLEQNGFNFTFVGNEQAAHEDDYPTYHAYADQSKKLDYFQAALKIVEERGGQIFYETTATELVGDSTKVTGVKAKEANGTILNITSPHVIMATGGAGANKELIKKYNGFDLMNISTGTQTGDAIKMGKALGVGEGKSIAELHGVTVPGYVPNTPEREPLTYLAYFPTSVFINHSGYRFVEEDIVFDTALTANAAYEQGGSYYSVMSTDMIDTLESKGPTAYGNYPDVNYQVGMPLYPVKEAWTGLTASLNKGVEEGTVIKGNTLEDLAKAIGVDPAILQGTFDQYNDFVKKGEDSMFGKKSPYLEPMNEGPYYAVVTVPVSLGQIGGLAVDSGLHALNNQGKVIQGLFLAGNDVASIYNNTYPTVEGISLGFAFNSGRLAAQTALKK